MTILILMILIKIHHYFLFRRINQSYINDSENNIDVKESLILNLRRISKSTNDVLLKRYVKVFILETYLFKFLVLLLLIIVIYNVFR